MDNEIEQIRLDIEKHCLKIRKRYQTITIGKLHNNENVIMIDFNLKSFEERKIFIQLLRLLKTIAVEYNLHESTSEITEVGYYRLHFSMAYDRDKEYIILPRQSRIKVINALNWEFLKWTENSNIPSFDRIDVVNYKKEIKTVLMDGLELFF